MRTSDLIIAEAVRQALAATVVLRFAEVTGAAGQVATVDLDGVPVPVTCIDGYAPTIGDRAWLLKQGTTIVAIGRQP